MRRRGALVADVKDTLENDKLYLNIGFLFDIPFGMIHKGKMGETIINGALPQVMAIAGSGNNYKSTTMHEAFLYAIDKIEASYPGLSKIITYDSEVNYVLDRLRNLAKKYKYLPDDVITSGLWEVSNAGALPGEKFLEKLMNLISEKQKDKSLYISWDALGKKTLAPDFLEIDSLSELDNSASEKLTTAISKDNTDSTTSNLAQGLFKSKFLSLLPRITFRGNIYTFMTIHVGKKNDIGNPSAKYDKNPKRLQFLAADKVFKGATGKSDYLIQTAIFGNTAKLLKHSSSTNSKPLPLYPSEKGDDLGVDLNIVYLDFIRSKSGNAGISLPVVVSQTDGFLEDMTHFHYIKENDRFGLGGSLQHYFLIIKQDVKLSNSTVRKKLKESYLLRRAVEVTAHFLLVKKYRKYLMPNPDLTIEELYEDLKKKGYDWDILLEHSRSWHTPKQYDVYPNYLSIYDLFNMYSGIYHPYWLEDDKKTIKKKYRRKDEK